MAHPTPRLPAWLMRPTALVVALICSMAGCSGGSKPNSAHSKVAKATPTPTPSGPCHISTTVTCVTGVLPDWTADVARAHLLGPKDVPQNMKHPFDPTWWGSTDYNQYFRRWLNGNYVPGCHYDWVGMNGSTHITSGYNLLWSDYGTQYPRWPQESITQYVYVYTDPVVQARDINAVWNHACTTGRIPYRQLLNGYYFPAEQVTDQTTQDVRSGWAHERIIEKRIPDSPGSPEEDVFDLLQSGNVLLVNWSFEQYTKDTKPQDWARTITDIDLMLDRQVTKLNTGR
jgi:hypothetical protein